MEEPDHAERSQLRRAGLDVSPIRLRRPSSAKTVLIERPMIASAPSRPSPSPSSTRAPASTTASSTGRSCCSSGNVVGARRRRRRRSAGAATAASQRRRKRSPATAAAAAMPSLAKRRSSHDGTKSLPARRTPREKKERKGRKRKETKITERYYSLRLISSNNHFGSSEYLSRTRWKKGNPREVPEVVCRRENGWRSSEVIVTYEPGIRRGKGAGRRVLRISPLEKERICISRRSGQGVSAWSALNPCFRCF